MSQLALPSLLSVPPIKLTSRPVIGFDRTTTRHTKRGDVVSKASFQLSEFGLVGLFAVYGVLRLAGIDLFAVKPTPVPDWFRLGPGGTMQRFGPTTTPEGQAALTASQRATNAARQRAGLPPAHHGRFGGGQPGGGVV